MSHALVGPYPFDLKTIVASARAALAAVGATLREGGGAELFDSAATGTDSGLYVLLSADGPDGKPAISGMWLVIDAEYLSGGPLGPPDRVPPFAQQLLDAATEEVWWQNLQVNRDKNGAWRPLVVLEWPPHMANRSALAPPGVPYEDEQLHREMEEERETWLEAVASPKQARQEIPSSQVERELDRFSDLPEQRSLIVLVRGHLKHDGKLHTGSYFMVPPELLDDGTQSAIALDDWVATARDLRQDDFEAVDRGDDARHRVGRPLHLPGERVGFISSAWLTRNLGIWPARPHDVALGALTDRVVQQKWIAQARLAISSSVMVIAMVLSFSGLVEWMTTPVPEPLEPPPPPAAQPAMSVCSADYQEFVDEFRCQIAHLAGRTDNGGFDPVCGDKGADVRVRHTEDDLQPALCALLDRQRDGWQADLSGGDVVNYSDFAAAQACFNVLGHPYPYRLRTLRGGTAAEPIGAGRVLGSPSFFLEHEELGIQPLKEMMEEVRAACATYRSYSESQVEGSILATHVGAPVVEGVEKMSGPSKLRRSMTGYALQGEPANAKVCFRKGINEGISAPRYLGMCGDPDNRVEAQHQASKMWVKLGGGSALDDEDGTRSAIQRYSGARFHPDGKKMPDLWRCHGLLNSETSPRLGTARGKWDITVPIPDRYDVRGIGVRNQLTLDAALRAFDEDGLDGGVCWRVVGKRLSTYRPVHPLLGEIEAEGWPSEEQRLCGQICAARFNVRRSMAGAEWVTAQEDLDQCVLADAGPENDFGANRLDKLRLPWNYAGRAEWIVPTQAQICAFNIVAQELMPQLDDGYTVAGQAGKAFAGETAPGSRIVGGEAGLAARYVRGLAFASRDSAASVAACGHVATQCFTAALLEVTGDERVERYRWLEHWVRRVEGMASMKRRDLAELDPWCVGIRDYLLTSRETAQFDTPCVTGVEEAREKAILAIRQLEQDTPF